MTKQEMLARLKSCPKWGEGCSANICPVYDAWRKCSMQSDDPVCFYLSEFVKEGSAARFQAAGLSHIYRQIGEVLPEVIEAHGRIRRALERSAGTGARMCRRIGK